MTTLGQSGPGSNNNEGMFHTCKISRTEALPVQTALVVQWLTSYEMNTMTRVKILV